MTQVHMERTQNPDEVKIKLQNNTHTETTYVNPHFWVTVLSEVHT